MKNLIATLSERIENAGFAGHWKAVKKILEKRNLLFTSLDNEVKEYKKNNLKLVGKDKKNALIIGFKRIDCAIAFDYKFYIPQLFILPIEWYDFMVNEWNPACEKKDGSLPMEKMVDLQKKYDKELFG